MKRKHYLLSVEIGGVENYAVRNLACIVGYKLSTDPARAETFGENIKKRWLAQYPSGRAEAVGDEQRPDLEEIRQIKRELQGPLREKPRKFGPRMPPKLGPVRPRAVKFGPRKPMASSEPAAEMATYVGDPKPGEEMVTYGRGVSNTSWPMSAARNFRKLAREYWDGLSRSKKEDLVERLNFAPDFQEDRSTIRSGSPIDSAVGRTDTVAEEVANIIRSSPEFLERHAERIERNRKLDAALKYDRNLRLSGIPVPIRFREDLNEAPRDYVKEAEDFWNKLPTSKKSELARIARGLNTLSPILKAEILKNQRGPRPDENWNESHLARILWLAKDFAKFEEKGEREFQWLKKYEAEKRAKLGLPPSPPANDKPGVPPLGGFKTYEEAKKFAVAQVRELRIAHGIEKPTAEQGYSVKMLPRPRKDRFGYDSRLEAFEPEDYPPMVAPRFSEPVTKFEASESPFALSIFDHTPAGFDPITPQHLPGNLTRDQLREWFVKNTSRLPIIPADVKDGVAWARARAVEAADEAFRITMQTGGKRLWAYFRPADRKDAPLSLRPAGFKDAPLSTEKFGANLRFAPVGTLVQWKIPYETFGRIYRKMDGKKFEWKEILPGPQGWRPTSTRGELVLRNIIANYNQAPAQFSILFPSDPKAEVYKLEASEPLKPRLSEEQIKEISDTELRQREERQQQEKDARKEVGLAGAESQAQKKKAVAAEENILAMENLPAGWILLESKARRYNLVPSVYRKMGPGKLEWRLIIKGSSGWKFLRAREGTTDSAASLFREMISQYRADPERFTLMSPYDNGGGRFDMSRDPGDRYTTPEPGMSDGEKTVEVEDPGFSGMLSKLSDRDFWEQYHDHSRNRPAYQRDAIAAELAKRVKKFGSLKGRALRMAASNTPVAFIKYADGIKAAPYLVNLPGNTILQINGAPTKGFKNPSNSNYILTDDGTWREFKMTGWNYETVYWGGYPTDVVRQLANARPSEILTFRPGSKEHARFMDKASSVTDVTPAVITLLREYMTGNRKKDAPGGIIRKYGPIDFHLLTRALASKLIERSDMNDPEAVKLTDKGRALLDGESYSDPSDNQQRNLGRA